MAARKGPVIESWEDILEIRDAPSAMKLMVEWNMDRAGIKTKEQAISLLIKQWIQTHGEIAISKSQKSRGFEHAMGKHQETRRKVIDMYQKARKFHDHLVPSIKKNLESSFQGLHQLFKEKEETLRTGECTILIAGEIGAGKSSLVNLLLGVQLFPTDAVQCTNTICEIRCSDGGRKEARLVSKAEISDSGEHVRKVPVRPINLDSLKGVQELKDCITENDEDGNNPYERIEIYWPFQMLGKGIVIVDTPGIEGGNNVDHRLNKYLTKAFGFIYVINTNAAGGVQNRLCHLLKMVVNSSEDFSPDASLFICNKWENVPEKDRDDVMRDTFNTLGRIYPGINRNQLHFMSTKKSLDIAIQYNARIKQHVVLLEKLEYLVPNCLTQGLISHYWWLSTVLKRMSFLLRVTSLQNATSVEDLELQRRNLKDHVAKLQHNTDECLKHLKEKIEFEMYRINKDLQDALNSTRLLNRICDWEDSRQCPSKQRKWKAIADEAAVKIGERVTREVDAWERETQKLERINSEIVNTFSKEMGLMEHQVKELEDLLLRNRDGRSFFHTMKSVPVKALFKKKRKQIEKTYSTLGGAVSCIGILDTTNKDVKSVFRDYSDSNKKKKMAEATILYLQSILNNRDLQGKLRKFFGRFFEDIENAAKRIPVYLQADQQLIETINLKIVHATGESEQLPEQLDEGSKIKSSLDILYVNSIMKFDFQPDDLDWGRKKRLGAGAFAEVFETVIKAKNRPVAAKVTTDPVSASNISDILMEDRTMRDLKNNYVVRYYGASFLYHDKSIKFVMVMERCVKNLRDIYTGHDRVEAYIPAAHVEGQKSRQSAIRKMATHAYQISQGLEYIHSTGYTHRDIKLENILLAVDDTVKITDVGIAKATNLLSQTCNGSPAYMAPEVLLGSRNHSSKIDVYSLAFIIWEMWFGRDVADEMNSVILGMDFHGDAMSKLKSRQGDKDGGWRPSLRAANRPPPAFVAILQEGWAYEPEARPEASVFSAFFAKFLANN